MMTLMQPLASKLQSTTAAMEDVKGSVARMNEKIDDFKKDADSRMAGFEKKCQFAFARSSEKSTATSSTRGSGSGKISTTEGALDLMMRTFVIGGWPELSSEPEIEQDILPELTIKCEVLDKERARKLAQEYVPDAELRGQHGTCCVVAMLCGRELRCLENVLGSSIDSKAQEHS